MSKQVQNFIDDARRFQRCSDHDLAISSLQLAQQEDHHKEHEIEIQKLFSLSYRKIGNYNMALLHIILGVEVAKLFGKPVVKMRKDRGKLEIDHLWDGEFSNGNRVLIVHDVLVSGEQIIHTKNHIPSRCEIVALCCLATRKDVNGLEVLQRENVRVERVIDLSDAEIESLMNQ